MRPFLLLLCLLVPPALTVKSSRTTAQIAASNIEDSIADDEDDDDDEIPIDFEEDEEYDFNSTEKRGMYLGSVCEFTCNPKLHHVFCDPITNTCQCEKKFPVKLGPKTGCAKPKRLGEQCYYTLTCSFMDQHASCTQVNHNAVCQCKAGYHLVSLSRPTKRVFCSEDLVLMTTSLSTLAGVFTGIAILAGLICFVLRLFTQTRYERPGHYASTSNMAPPILFSSDTGIPLTSQSGTGLGCGVGGGARSASRSSQRSSGTCISTSGGFSSRRPSSAQGSGSRGVLMPSSRAGAARAAAILLISCQVKPTTHGGVLREESEEQSSLASAEPPLATTDDDDDDHHHYIIDTIERHEDVQSVPNSPTRLGNTSGVTSGNRLRDSGFNVFNKAASLRLGSRRPSLASVHSAGSSRSFGGRMLERERLDREQRQEMKVRLARMASLPSSLPKMSSSSIATAPTPSPLSTDELLPSVSEVRQVCRIVSVNDVDLFSSLHGEIGPCSSKDCQ